MLHPLSKLDAVLACRDSGMEIALQGQPVMRAFVRAAAKPRSVILNGRRIDPAHDPKNRAVIVVCGTMSE